jgi:hypothetical protein
VLTCSARALLSTPLVVLRHHAAFTIATIGPGNALPSMPPNPLRIAQTTSEVKKQHKQNGPRLPAHQVKQLERGHVLDVRAARLRDAEDRRKAAKKKREEREEKEKAARRQMGVGLATQLIGYSHTQAQLKTGMEAFLGLKRRNEQDQRRRDLELTKKLEAIAKHVDKEPWDDDDDDDLDNNMALDLPPLRPSVSEPYIDDDLDDDTMLEVHALVMSDPVLVPPIQAQQPTPLPPTPLPPLPRPATPGSFKLSLPKDDADFARLHGPINRAIECLLDALPEPLVELLSMDSSLKLPDWNPAPSLLHKLNPLGVPPHRLRIKVGGVVILLRDLNTSSQLSKSQHLRILRIENERLECLVLDGQLKGTNAVLTRVKFVAKYRNDDLYPFQRTQYPFRVATDFRSASTPRDISQSGFKLPSMPTQARSSSVVKRPVPAAQKAKPHGNNNPGFKLPGLPASNAPASNSSRPWSFRQPAAPFTVPPADGWEEFFDSGTQIARELSAEVTMRSILPDSITAAVPSTAKSLLPLSTQDFDFSMGDLDNTPILADLNPPTEKLCETLLSTKPVPDPLKPANTLPSITRDARSLTRPTPSLLLQSKTLPRKTCRTDVLFNFASLTPSQKPRSISDRPAMKRKIFATPTKAQLPPAKRLHSQVAQPVTALESSVRQKVLGGLCDFGISTQEAASFFADDEDLCFGSPPITV